MMCRLSVHTASEYQETGAEWMGNWRLSDAQKRKYEQAERFGLTGALLERGWGGLSARDAGRIGGALHGRKNTRYR